jgi:exopolysaccharide/PEP-CTERM locus tyrosine autokinase
MNQHTPLRTGGSLLERAAELYGFSPVAQPLPAPVPAPGPEPKAEPKPEPEVATSTKAPELRAPAPQPKADAPAPHMKAEASAPQPEAKAPAPKPQAQRETEAPEAQPEAPKLRPARALPKPVGTAAVDREALREAGFIEPDAPAGGLAEEFRIVKRQLIDFAGTSAKGRTILVCSAQPDEGKTFCAVNLALSLAAERDREVLLIDADFPKPEVLSILGLEGGTGLVDALSNPALDPESLVIRTDVPGLSVLPAGRHVSNVTELLASERTREVFARLAEANPRRILLFDAPPALLASPASVLAAHAGQLLLVVRADQTTEADLREAVALLSACSEIRLLLNGAGFAATGRRFGSYYGYGQ